MTEPINALGASAQVASEAQVAQEQQAQGQGQQTPPEADHARYRQLRDRLQAEVNGVAEQISNDPSTDNGYKHRALSHLWNQAQEADRKISALYANELQDIVAEQEKKVFRVPKDLKDSVRSSYQMVTNEVDLAGLEEEGFEGIQAGREKLEQLYERAARTQDKALMLAVYHYATEKGLHDLRDRHLATSGELARAWESYTAARKKQANWHDREENLIQRLDGRRGIVKPP